MSKKGPTRQQVSSGLTYVAQKPSFLQNFGKKPPSPPPTDRFGGPSGSDHPGREPLPERPKEGKWAGGSDDEDAGKVEEDEEEDEWEATYGGGDDGPQVVVLKEGRHLDAESLKRERRRAAGKPSVSPPPPEEKELESKERSESRPKPHIQKPVISSAKRKLVGQDVGDEKDAAVKPSDGDAKTKKKKKKMDKGLLSFNEGDGDG